MGDHRKGSVETSVDSRKQHAAGLPRPNATDRHHERLQDLYASALDVQDPRQSSIRYAMAELLEVGSALTDAIKGEMRERKQTLREMRKGPLQAIGYLGVLHRQISRYAQIDRDLSAASDADGPPALPPPHPCGNSEDS